MKQSIITPSGFSRRQFVKGGLAASAFAAFPHIATAETLAGNKKINLACCGIGNRGGAIINDLMKTGQFNIVALCDTQIGAKHTTGTLKKYPKAPQFQDFRKMLDKMGDQIQAVSVGVPDHSHFPICMMAMAMGKGVYVEKPLAHTVNECNLLMQAEKKYKVAAQMGNQGHSGDNYYQFREWFKQGVLANITRVDAHMTKGRRWHKWNSKVPGMRPGMEIPKEMDWDTWLGQTPFQEFHTDYINGDWRCWFEWGNGALGDWGAHIVDTAHEFLQLGMPEEVKVEMMDGHNDFVFPMGSTLRFKFPERGDKLPAMDIVWHDGLGNLPELPDGFLKTKAASGDAPPSGGSGSSVKVKLSPGKIIHRADGVSFKGSSHSSPLALIKNDASSKLGDLPDYEKGQPNHFMDFALGVKGEKKCNSRFEVSGELSKVLCLGCIAQRLNKGFKFDRKSGRITDNKVADQLLVGPPPRKGWEEFYKV